MRVNEAMENDETVFPIFYKKKELPIDKIEELKEIMRELMEKNEETMINEKLMLEKIRIKDNEFVKNLEDHLEQFKVAGIEKIVLKQDMLPVWSEISGSLDAIDSNMSVADDTTERLNEWCYATEAYVNLQRDEVNQIISDWFSQMDKIATEGEPDPQIVEQPGKIEIDNESIWEKVSWYIALILVCVLNMFIFFKQEDIEKCVDDGYYKCFIRVSMNVCTFLRDHYLRFHNITLDHPSTDLTDNSIEFYDQYTGHIVLTSPEN